MSRNDYLAHYGVLGMKWGVRKDKKSSGVKKRRSRKKELKSMSDDELRKKINRLNMERQYKDLTKTNLEKGKDYVMGIASTSYKAATTAALTAAIAARYKKIDWDKRAKTAAQRASGFKTKTKYYTI